MFNARAFFQEFHIQTITAHHKRARSGWVQTSCPFCGGRDGHLGVHLRTGLFNCWKCGGKGRIQAIMALAKCDKKEALRVLRDYYTDEFISSWESGGNKRAKMLELPDHRAVLPDKHRAYLEDRGFDPDELQAVWGIQGTGFSGWLKHRILIPIFYQERLISWTSRDITGLAAAKYISCPKEEEVVNHKSILYGIDLCIHNKVVLVEGPMDVQKLGPGAAGTFGTDFTEAQVRLIAQRFDEACILFDPEPAAQAQAKKLAFALSSLGVEAEIAQTPDCDPGDLTAEQAEYVMQQLLYSS